jgi:hypothetical protein
VNIEIAHFPISPFFNDYRKLAAFRVGADYGAAALSAWVFALPLGRLVLHMKRLIFGTVLLSLLRAQSLPVVPMQTDDPDQLAQRLRRKEPIPTGDCRALNLWECHPDEPRRITDISMRWVQLDEDPQLEAILITEAKAENTYAAYIFDRQGTWNLVGAFFDRQWTSDGQGLIRVQKLTEDSPSLLLVTRDLGGSGSVILTTEAFQLREGKLWPVITITDKEEDAFPSPSIRRQQVLSSRSRLVIHTMREEPPGHVAQNKCEVRRWDAIRHEFTTAAGEETEYCEPKTGKPIKGKSSWAGLPIYP